jgi:predicted transposase/invertase (TIGR01784 family)
MRTDTIFYQLFQLMPNLLSELLGKVGDDYQFKSVEIKELSRRIDGVFLPKDNNTQQPIYFAEVQFQADERLYERLITETFLYLGQYRPEREWLCVALWLRQSIAVSIPRHYQALAEAGLLRLIYLEELDSNSLGTSVLSLVTVSEATVPERLQKVVTQLRTLTDERLQEQLIELVEKMLIYRFPDFSKEVLQAMFTDTDIKQTRFYRDVFQEGLQEGRQEGRQEERQQIIARLRQRGFAVNEVAEMLALSGEEVTKLWGNN